MKRKIMAVMFICSMGQAAAMDQQQQQEAMLQRVMALAEAATRAAVAAETVAARSAQPPSSSGGEGLQAATKILKSPDMFSGDDALAFPGWRFQFTSWLTYGESKYVQMLQRIETMTTMPDITTYQEHEKELAHRLYAVLTSYLKGRCGHMCKAASRTRDGFAVWWQLIREFEPSTRQRSLALAQALSSYPAFPKDKSCLESILIYEETVQRFEESSGNRYPDELKIATLVRCAPQRLREHLQLSLSETATYAQVKEQIIAYERASKAWTQESVLKSINNAHKAADSSEAIPMEVDRVEKGYKGKGKGKKGKGKSGNWNIPWGAGRGFGRGRGQKGKGKKGRGRGSGKGKNKGKKGAKGKDNQKGKTGPNQCKLCHGYGHWSNECPYKMDVNNVQEQQYPVPPGAGNTQSNSSAGNRASASSTAYVPNHGAQAPQSSQTVRRIFHITPSTSSPSSPSNVRMVSVEEIFDETEVEIIQDVQRVQGEEEEWIILDSGSDVSLLPSRYATNTKRQRNHQLTDCQGGTLRTRGTRQTDLQVVDSEGEEILLRHEFIIGDVTTGLLSLGQL